MKLKPLLSIKSPSTTFRALPLLETRASCFKEDSPTPFHTGPVELIKEWYPQPRIIARFSNYPLSHRLNPLPTQITFGEGTTTDKKSRIVAGEDTIVDFVLPWFKYGEPTGFSKLEFYVFNNFRINPPECPQESKSLPRMLFEYEDWEIEIQNTPSHTKNLKNKKRFDGSVNLNTHIGSIKRKNGKAFSYKKVEKILDALKVFLSFAEGFHISIDHFVGFGLDGNAKYWCYITPTIFPREYRRNWFISTSFPSLKVCFAKFVEQFQSEEWGMYIVEAIDFYIEVCNSSNPDLKLASTQIILEALSFHVNSQEKWINSATFIKLPAADKLHLLVAWAGISVKETGKIELSGEQKQQTGPEITSDLRNWFVHPNKTNRDKLSKTELLNKHYASNLSIWYLECILLKLLGYQGEYFNRAIEKTASL